MFKIFKSKKKSKKEKEQKQQQEQEQQHQQQQQKQRDKSDEKKKKNDDNKENTPSKQQQSQSQVQQQHQQISTDKTIKTSLTNINDNNNNKIGSSPSSPTSNKTNGLVLRKQENDLIVDCNYQTPAVETTTATTTNNTNNAAVSTVTNTATNSCQASPSGYSETLHNDSHFHASHLRESQLSGTFSGADLNRILTSGYITGDEDMGYMKRGTIQPKTPKSPHFHRPANFSYSHHPHLLVNKKSSKGYLSSTLSSVNTVKKIRHCSNSPTRNSENEEPIRLSKYSGGYVPDPTTPKKIESLDWPSPPYPPAVPELRNRSRSSSSHKTPTKHHRQSEEETEIHDTIDGTTKKQNEQKKIKTYGKVYDDDFNDYLARFRIHSRNSDKYNSMGDNDAVDDDENIDECDNVRQNEKLKREIDEISKLESKSGIAKILAKELKAQEKYVKHASIDPWKASRTPSASIEPVQKTRFESPVNASPSRIYKGSGHHNLSYNSYDDALCSTSAISTTSSTAIKDPLCSTPRKAGTIPKTHVPKPGYTLSSPKSVTLPNSSRYNGMSTHRSVDFDSSGLASSSYYGGHTHEELQNIKSDKKILMNTTNTYKNYNIETRNSHATRSTPNLIGTPKVYTYNELKIGYKKKLPPDVDPERLERHLSPEEFKKIFGIDSIEKFYELPEWKRIELKKRAKLF